MRKLTLVVVLLLALALGALTAGAQDLPDASALQGITVTYWHQYNNDFQKAQIDALVELFNTTNEYGITVEAVAQGNYDDLRNLMNGAIVSGDLPNMVAGFPNDGQSYALDGVVVDLQPYFDDATYGFSDEEAAKLLLPIYDGWLADGVRLGWVNQVSANVLFVNNAMVTALGFDGGIKTLDDFRAVSCAAANSDLTGADGAAVQGFPIVADSSQFESFVASIGGSIWVDGAWNFTSDAAVEILTMYADLYREGCAYIPQERFGNTNDFARGLNPMALGSSAGISITLGNIDAAANVVTDWAVMATPPLADGDTPAIQLFTPGIMALTATPEEQLASWLFLKWFAGTEAQKLWTEGLGFIPTNTEAAGLLDATKLNPYFLSIVSALSSGAASVYIAHQDLSYGTVRGIVAQGLADVTSGGMDVMDVANRMNDDAAQALADSMNP